MLLSFTFTPIFKDPVSTNESNCLRSTSQPYDCACCSVSIRLELCPVLYATPFGVGGVFIKGEEVLCHTQYVLFMYSISLLCCEIFLYLPVHLNIKYSLNLMRVRLCGIYPR